MDRQTGRQTDGQDHILSQADSLTKKELVDNHFYHCPYSCYMLYIEGGWEVSIKENFYVLREGVKNTQRGGSLKFAAEGRKTPTPPKNS